MTRREFASGQPLTGQIMEDQAVIKKQAKEQEKELKQLQQQKEDRRNRMVEEREPEEFKALSDDHNLHDNIIKDTSLDKPGSEDLRKSRDSGRVATPAGASQDYEDGTDPSMDYDALKQQYLDKASPKVRAGDLQDYEELKRDYLNKTAGDQRNLNAPEYELAKQEFIGKKGLKGQLDPRELEELKKKYITDKQAHLSQKGLSSQRSGKSGEKYATPNESDNTDLLI